ncbi:MAG: ABC transporter permease, partial [Anaerolineae bacterium]
MDIHIIERDGYHTSISVINSVSRLQYLSLAVRQSKLRLQELWTFKGMIRTLVITDLKIRYKDSVLGVAWSLLNPLLMMVVFTVVFTVFRNSPVKDFPAFLLTGLLPWQLFANSVVSTTGSIVGNGYLISKIYFPKEILVISSVLSNLIHFLTRLLILFP